MIESSPPDYRFSFRNVNGFPVVAASDNLYRLRMREKTLQDRLREARKRAGLSQSAVASAVGIAQGTYSDLERNTGSGSKHIVAIARVLGVSPDWLLTGEGSETPQSAKVREEQRATMEAMTQSMPDAELKRFIASALCGLSSADQIDVLATALRQLHGNVSSSDQT